MNLTHPNQYDFLPRFYRLAIINILSNIVVPLAGLLSVAFLGHLTEIRHLDLTFFSGDHRANRMRTREWLLSGPGGTAPAPGSAWNTTRRQKL